MKWSRGPARAIGCSPSARGKPHNEAARGHRLRFARNSPTALTTATLVRRRSRWPGELLLALRRDPLTLFARLAAEHGDAVHLRFARQDVLLLSHPDHARELLVTRAASFRKGMALERARVVLGDGLLTSEGEVHRRRRQLLQPAFARPRLEPLGAAMVEITGRRAEGWAEGEVLDVAQEMGQLTLAIAARTLFGADVEEDAGEIGRALATVLGMASRLVVPFSGLLQRLPLPSSRRFARARDLLDRVIAGLIAKRRRGGDGGEAPADLLGLLLAARDRDAAGLGDREVRDEAMTLFLAGHETTANALAWTWLLLEFNPGAAERLHAEIDQVLAGRAATVADLPRLVYAEQVLAESMRLYPPAWAIGRRALEDVAIGGIAVPRGALVIASPWIVHRDPRWWPDPLRFDPDRFAPAAAAAADRPRLAYFPFGDGPRRCIGEGFAWMEGVLLLATLAQQVTFRLVPGHRVATRATITLRPRHGLRMTVARRRPGA